MGQNLLRQCFHSTQTENVDLSKEAAVVLEDLRPVKALSVYLVREEE